MVGATGFEPATRPTQVAAAPAVCGADHTSVVAPVVADAGLAEVARAWPALAEPLRRAILAIVEAHRSCLKQDDLEQDS
jgi:hypothetical protein